MEVLQRLYVLHGVQAQLLRRLQMQLLQGCGCHVNGLGPGDSLLQTYDLQIHQICTCQGRKAKQTAARSII